MKFTPVAITLKNGAVVSIREAVKKDASALIETVSRYIIDSQHLISIIEEFNPTIDEEKKWIHFYNEKNNSLLLVACYKNKIIGNIEVRGEIRQKIKHNATLGIGILHQWQNIGLGTALLQQAISWAKENPTLENIWLHVHATNTAAIHLYKKLNFVQAGQQRNYIKEVNGIRTDNILMLLDVSN